MPFPRISFQHMRCDKSTNAVRFPFAVWLHSISFVCFAHLMCVCVCGMRNNLKYSCNYCFALRMKWKKRRENEGKREGETVHNYSYFHFASSKYFSFKLFIRTTRLSLLCGSFAAIFFNLWKIENSTQCE